MTYRCTRLSLSSLLALSCSLTLGCDGPQKTVGQETDGGTESSSESGGSETGGSESGGSESGGSEDCGTLEDATACQAGGCAWRNTSTVSLVDSTCEIGEGAGNCSEPIADDGNDGCIGLVCEDGSTQHWTREVGDGVWETFSGTCFAGSPDGFTLCEYDGNDPAACDCLCPGGETSLPSGFETMLGASGCADMTVYGATPDGSIGLALSTGFEFDPVAAAVAAGETTTTTHDVTEFSRLSVYVGTNVTYPECNDALDKSAYSIDQEWIATAGTVEIEIEPIPDAQEFETQGYATVTITDLEVSFGTTVETVGTVTFDDVGVGWLPG